jgi:hypothetical protein
MKMVWHETPCEHFDRIPLSGNLYEVNEHPVVSVLVKDLLSAVTAIDDVVAAVIR